MDLKRILVAVDTANGRDAAFERALSVARGSGAELYLLHAVPADHPFSAGGRERLERTQELRRRGEQAGVHVHTVEQQGDPADLIELHADTHDVDLIVLGSEPQTGWSPRRRSRVAERVLRRTSRPTLIVAAGARGADANLRSVLVALDLTEGSESLISKTTALTAGETPALSVMHSVTGIEAADAVRSAARWKVPEYRAHVLEDARQKMDALVPGVAPGIDAHVRITTGPAARAILEQAAEVHADLIVMGKSGGFKPLGSTALQVLRRHDRTLLVIPTTAARRTSQLERAA